MRSPVKIKGVVMINSSQKSLPKTAGDFIKEIAPYTSEKKCILVKETARELLKRGGNRNIATAENILIYATQHCFDVSDSQLKADVYYCLGELYEKHKENFIRAHTFYEKYTLNNKNNGASHSLLLKSLILRDDFRYSDELEKEFRMSLAESDLGLKNDRIYENLGRYIVLKHENKSEEAEKVMKRLWEIIRADELLILKLIPSKDNYPDSVRVPKKVVEFINETYSPFYSFPV